MLALALGISCLGQLPNGVNDLQVLLALKSWNDVQILVPSSSEVVYNIAVGFLFGILIAAAVAAAFLSARWVQQSLQTRFSALSLQNADLPQNNVVLSLILIATLAIADFFFQVFRAFDQSFESFPLLHANLLPLESFSKQFSDALIQAGAEIFFVAFLSSSFLFFAVFVVTVSLVAGVKYVGKTAIDLTDAGLSFMFMILVLSASVYASSSFIEKAQQEAAAKLSELQVTQ